MSGHVQCHGFDQAAIGTLLLTRIYGMGSPDPNPNPNPSTAPATTPNPISAAAAGWGKTIPFDPFPFNHTCTWSDEGFSGCNAKVRHC